MRPATLLFYAFASLCLGAVSVATGPTMLAYLIGVPELVESLSKIWGAVTIGITLAFLIWSIGAAVTNSREPNE